MDKCVLSKKPHYAWVILAGLCITQFAGGGTIINCAGLFFSDVTKELGFTVSKLALYLTIGQLCLVLMLPIVGKLLPKINIRVLLTASYAGVFLGAGLMSQYTKVWQFYLSGAIIGICGSFVFTIVKPVIVGNWFHKKYGFAMGLQSAFAGIGGLVMSPVISLLITNFGWRTAYILQAIVCSLIAFPFTIFVFRFKPSDMGLKPYGYDENEAANKENQKIVGAGVSAKKAFRSPTFYCLFVAFGLISFLTAYNNLLPSYASSIKFSAVVGATMLSTTMAGNLIGKLLIGICSDKFGVKKVSATTLVLVAASYVILIVSGGNLALALVGSFLYGICQSINMVVAPILTKTAFGAKEYSSIFSILALGQNLIGAFGVTIVGLIYDTCGTYIPAFALGSGLSILAILLIFTALKTAKKLEWSNNEVKEIVNA